MAAGSKPGAAKPQPAQPQAHPDRPAWRLTPSVYLTLHAATERAEAKIRKGGLGNGVSLDPDFSPIVEAVGKLAQAYEAALTAGYPPEAFTRWLEPGTMLPPLAAAPRVEFARTVGVRKSAGPVETVEMASQGDPDTVTENEL
jgi:hypothetical protein